jgi:long-chain acyl-CoA synthetase
MERGKLKLWDKPMTCSSPKRCGPRSRRAFGGRMKAMVSGGAPLNPDVGVFFHSMGLTLLQGYGQTESAR